MFVGKHISTISGPELLALAQRQHTACCIACTPDSNPLRIAVQSPQGIAIVFT